MLPEVFKIVKIEALKPILKGGGTWASLWRVMYYTRKFRYITQDQLRQIDGIDDRVSTLPKLRILCDLKYFRESSKEVFTATNEVMGLLQKVGCLTRFLPAVTEGEGGINALANTSAFIKALKVPDYYDLIFPEFTYIDPDALLVQKYGEKYKLTFLEVESEKFGWDNYLENKRDNYLKLAKDIAFYDFWKEASRILGLRIPTKQELKFNVTFVCSLKRDFGKCFNFKEQL
ncbi:MAG: hypothetical protein JSS91_00870 [Bacteroidetes bacterium]|nr:hypothetical protein [Bacteroidota bacterium]